VLGRTDNDIAIALEIARPIASDGLIPVDIDATIVTAHSDKQQAAPTWKENLWLPPGDGVR
jgi:hypothetical protein